MTEHTTLVWESLKTVNRLVNVFETCIDFGLNLTDTKKLLQDGKEKNGWASGVFFEIS